MADGDVCCSAADVNGHVAVRLCYGKTCADGCGHGLFDQINFGCFGAVGRVFNGAALDLSNLRWNSYDYARAYPRLSVMSLAYKMLKHLFCHFKVGYDAVLHWTYGDDVAGRATQHLFCIASDGFYRVCDFVDGDD